MRKLGRLMTPLVGALLGLPVMAMLLILLADNASSDAASLAVTSEDGRYAARVEERNSGAMTEFLTRLWLIDKGLGPGTVFPDRYAVFVYRGQPESTAISWKGPRELLVEYTDCRRVHEQVNKWHGVTIEYQADCKAAPLSSSITTKRGRGFPGPSVSVTTSPYSVSERWNAGFQVNMGGMAAQVGYAPIPDGSPFYELGVGSPGVSGSGYYVFTEIQ